MGAMLRKFWWEAKPNSQGFVALKVWNDVCKLKDLGGLGFCHFHDMNMALISKLT